MKSTVYQIELNNGEKVKLTLNFGRLYQLRAKNKQLYDDYNAAQRKNKNEFGELDMALIIYTAYVCANIEDHLDMVDFFSLLPEDRVIVSDAMKALLNPSKK